MDKAGTMPIYVYNNCEVPEFVVQPSSVPQIRIELEENEDDLNIEQPSTSTISSRGRKRKKTALGDMVFYQ